MKSQDGETYTFVQQRRILTLNSFLESAHPGPLHLNQVIDCLSDDACGVRLLAVDVLKHMAVSEPCAQKRKVSNMGCGGIATEHLVATRINDTEACVRAAAADALSRIHSEAMTSNKSELTRQTANKRSCMTHCEPSDGHAIKHLCCGPTHPLAVYNKI